MFFDEKKTTKIDYSVTGTPHNFFVKKKQENFLKFHTQENLLDLIKKHKGYPFQNLEFSLSPTMSIFN